MMDSSISITLPGDHLGYRPFSSAMRPRIVLQRSSRTSGGTSRPTQEPDVLVVVRPRRSGQPRPRFDREDRARSPRWQTSEDVEAGLVQRKEDVLARVAEVASASRQSLPTYESTFFGARGVDQLPP